MLLTLIEESHEAYAKLQLHRQQKDHEQTMVDRGFVDPAVGSILIGSAQDSVTHAEVVAKKAKKALLEYLGLA